jgi:hypothetical protein
VTSEQESRPCTTYVCVQSSPEKVRQSSFAQVSKAISRANVGLVTWTNIVDVHGLMNEPTFIFLASNGSNVGCEWRVTYIEALRADDIESQVSLDRTIYVRAYVAARRRRRARRAFIESDCKSGPSSIKQGILIFNHALISFLPRGIMFLYMLLLIRQGWRVRQRPTELGVDTAFNACYLPKVPQSA